jgi:hypothetical protein
MMRKRKEMCAMNRRRVTITLMVMLTLLLGVSGTVAQNPRPRAEVSLEATVNSRISYQGVLKENGNPVTGNRDMTFRLHANDACTNQVGGDIVIPGVPVADGLFSVALDVAHDDLNGQGLWLEVEVDGTAVVCQEILPVPYALSLRPGANVIGELAGANTLTVENSSTAHDSRAIRGYASATTGFTAGVQGRTDSSTTGAKGVWGYAAGGGQTYGVHGESNSTSGRGVYGRANTSSGTNYGVYGESNSASGIGVYGTTSATSGETYGVYGVTHSSYGRGVYGESAYSSGGTGVYGHARGWGSSIGVYGKTDSGFGSGVHGENGSSQGYAYGVYGVSYSHEGDGVHGYAHATSGPRYGVYGDTNTSGYGLYTPDNLYVGGSCTGCLMTFLAHNASLEMLRPGAVVTVSGVGPVLQGHTTPILEVRPATIDDASILGVVYMRGEFYAANDDQSREEAGDSVQPVEGDVAPGDYLLVVTSGLAQVRIALVRTGLSPGQGLTIGNAAGLATLAGPDARSGIIFARAMEAQPDENGLLWAMIDTQ